MFNIFISQGSEISFSFLFKQNGQTPLSLANKLGYITIVETLKVVTETNVSSTVTGTVEEKYKVIAPEGMHETFMSDSEDEGKSCWLGLEYLRYARVLKGTGQILTHYWPFLGLKLNRIEKYWSNILVPFKTTAKFTNN